MIKYSNEPILEFCIEHGIRIDPKYTSVFLRYGLVEVFCRYEDYHSKMDAMRAALLKLIDDCNTPVDPKIGVFKRHDKKISEERKAV